MSLFVLVFLVPLLSFHKKQSTEAFLLGLKCFELKVMKKFNKKLQENSFPAQRPQGFTSLLWWAITSMIYA